MGGEPLDIDEAERSMDAEMSSPHHEYPDNPGGVLYHYTDARGLLGIVRDRVMWATDFRHLNDRNEMEGEQVAVDELSKLADQEPTTQDAGAAKALFGRIHHEFQKRPPSSLLHILVASFTTQGDQLSQWRGYTKEGYSIGISLKAVHLPQGHAPGSDIGVGLAKCLYVEADFREHIRLTMRRNVEVMRRYVQDPRRSGNDRERLYRNGLLNCLADLGTLAPRYKDRSFREEEEYRLVAVVPTNSPRKHKLLRFRTTAAGRLLPYVEIPLQGEGSKLPLTNVCLGPTHDVTGAESAARTLLECHAHDPDLVVRSKIPFRG